MRLLISFFVIVVYYVKRVEHSEKLTLIFFSDSGSRFE